MLVAGAAWHTERVNTACYVLPLATSCYKNGASAAPALKRSASKTRKVAVGCIVCVR